MKDKEARTPPNEKEWHLEVSQEQYDTTKAKGFDEETLFKPGKHKFQRRNSSKILKRENHTVVLHLDEETYRFYKQRADEQKSESVEEQINSELRTILEKEIV